MISDWQTINTQDNDVHELFKCIGETVLTNAFIVEQADGTISGYNCRIKQLSDGIQVIPNEKQITNLHCNLKKANEVSFSGKTKKIQNDYLGWF